jgi:hypothetical protein
VASVAVAARLVLGATLALAAVRKVLLGPTHSARAFRTAGVPAALARPVAIGTPLAEVGVAASLVMFPRSPAPAILAAALLVAFTAFVVLRSERAAPCPCFGTSAATPPARIVVRNGVLLALTVPAAAAPAGATGTGVAVAGVVLGLIVGFVVAWSEGEQAPAV